jgi:high-affinity nickel-transport protein
MTSLIAILGFGFLLGMRHATDPDHVIAVSTIVSRERSIAKAGLIGALWGVGHTLTILIVGAAIILLGIAIPTRLGLTMEFSVGLMLILLGILNLTGVLTFITDKFSPAHPKVDGSHAHLHEHENAKLHIHWHTHTGETQHHAESLAPPRWFDRSGAKATNKNANAANSNGSANQNRASTNLGLFHTLRPLFIGLVHGLAGSAAVALLVLSTIHNPKWAVLYLLIFGVGTVAGMMLITAVISLPFSFAGYKFAWLNKSLIVGSGVLSLAFGVFVCYHIGFIDGLFTSHPTWIPS